MLFRMVGEERHKRQRDSVDKIERVRRRRGRRGLVEQLALDITNNAADAKDIQAPQKITRGTVISVLPLLKDLEDRVRFGVVVAANAPAKNAGFGTADIGVVQDYNESQVAAVFGALTTPPTAWPKVDCCTMVELEWAFGLTTQLRYGEFAALGLSPSKLWDNYKTGINGTLKPGDWVMFQNYYQYQSRTNKGLCGGRNTRSRSERALTTGGTAMAVPRKARKAGKKHCGISTIMRTVFRARRRSQSDSCPGTREAIAGSLTFRGLPR